jgi:hypothetical protein
LHAVDKASDAQTTKVRYHDHVDHIYIYIYHNDIHIEKKGNIYNMYNHYFMMIPHDGRDASTKHRYPNVMIPDDGRDKSMK